MSGKLREKGDGEGREVGESKLGQYDASRNLNLGPLPPEKEVRSYMEESKEAKKVLPGEKRLIKRRRRMCNVDCIHETNPIPK
jgi:hypothetical protein